MQFEFGNHLVQNYNSVLNFESGFTDEITPMGMLSNSLIIAIGVGVLTTLLSFFTAYSIVFFKYKSADIIFWLVLSTLLFPLEARFIPTFQIASYLGLINTHLGIILPVIAAALGTFFFRQYFLSLPEELLEAALLDGAGSFKFALDILIPLSLSRAAAIFIIAFMIGWNQYLWPIMISTDDTLYTLVRGIRFMGQGSGTSMAFTMITIAPPFILVLIFQRWFFSGLGVENKLSQK
ncbi:ABC transporter permease subunit [Amylibacter sp.]|nr:ABC transporter permease subunit [Amylibacter sp.]